MVLVVVEGGTDAISDASKSLKSDIPVVLCAGTNRAADILAFAHTFCSKKWVHPLYIQKSFFHYSKQYPKDKYFTSEVWLGFY